MLWELIFAVPLLLCLLGFSVVVVVEFFVQPFAVHFQDFRDLEMFWALKTVPELIGS